ncbi:MAG: glutamate 5-kinase, partial [Myxococcota bacterium]|nr:glutamate 5-kinase [Myxococcota bacterium]
MARARRLVVKVGSQLLAGSEGRARIEFLAADVASLVRDGRQVVVVSSGAIALGMPRLGLRRRPAAMPLLQAAAAAGQSRLMHAWEEALAAHGLVAAQVLLTHADLAERDRWRAARATFEALLGRGAVPVVNENDTVAVDEIRFGDNDQLAAMLGTLVDAELLVLLTDVEGLLDARGRRVPVVESFETAATLVRPGRSREGTGGMTSKLEAARRATLRGVPVVVASVREPHAVTRIAAGEDVGTLFVPRGKPLGARRHWIAFTLRPRGALLLDAGAVRAIVEHGRSLLPAGVLGVRGDFEPGDAVSLVGPDGREVARGLCRYGTRELARLAGSRSGAARNARAQLAEVV